MNEQVEQKPKKKRSPSKYVCLNVEIIGDQERYSSIKAARSAIKSGEYLICCVRERVKAEPVTETKLKRLAI